MTRGSAEGARRGWGRETGSESGLWAGAGGLWERAGKGACSAWRRKSRHRRSEGGMAMAPWRSECARQCARGGVIKHSTTHSRASRLRASGGSPPIRRTQPLACPGDPRPAALRSSKAAHPHLPLLRAPPAQALVPPVPNWGLNEGGSSARKQRLALRPFSGFPGAVRKR